MCDRGTEEEVEVGSVAAFCAQRRSDAADGFFALGMLRKQQQQLCPGCSLKALWWVRSISSFKSRCYLQSSKRLCMSPSNHFLLCSPHHPSKCVPLNVSSF